MKRKSEAFQALKSYIAFENQLNSRVKTIRSDQDGDFSSQVIGDWLASKGIQHVFTPTAAHEQNGRVE